MTVRRKWIGYLLFAVALIGFFLYFCFPSEALRGYLEGSAARFAPGLALSVHSVQPALPFGLKLENTDLGLRKSPQVAIFKADRLLVMPSMRTLALGKPAFRFDCEAYGGKIEGVLAFNKFSWEGPVHSDVKINGLHLGQYPCLQRWLQGEVTGAMSGTLIYVGVPEDLIHGSGEGNLSILNGSFRFVQPFLGMESVAFHRLDAQMVLEEQKISLTSLNFDGKQVKGTASGNIYLQPKIAESSLDLKVALKGFSAFLKQKGDYTIAIRGTFDQPKISFM